MRRRGIYHIIKDLMKKKGLSTVIAVLLMILLSLVAIAILWVVISSVVYNQSGDIEAENKFFTEPVDVAQVQIDPNNNLLFNISLRKSGGSFNVELEEGSIYVPIQIDVVSVADLSGSMRVCASVNNSCDSASECTNILGGTDNGNDCIGINSTGVPLCLPRCGGTLTDGLSPTQDANEQLTDIIFQNAQDNNRMGLVAYNTTVVTALSPNLTNNATLLKIRINQWESDGSTCICCGINDARNKLAASNSTIPKTMIIMSDGVATVQCAQQGSTPDLNGNGQADDSGDDAIRAACQADAAIPNLTIHAVGLGSGIDNSTMSEIAECGQGLFFTATDVDDLIGIYQSLGQQITSTSAVPKFAHIKIIFYDSLGNQAIEVAEIPKPLETNTYSFNLAGKGLTPPVVKIEIYPVSVDKTGKQTIGPLFDMWEKT